MIEETVFEGLLGRWGVGGCLGENETMGIGENRRFEVTMEVLWMSRLLILIARGRELVLEKKEVRRSNN